MAKYVVAAVDEIREGGHLVVDINGRSVGVFRIDGEFYGLLNRCPHRGGSLFEGKGAKDEAWGLDNVSVLATSPGRKQQRPKK